MICIHIILFLLLTNDKQVKAQVPNKHSKSTKIIPRKKLWQLVNLTIDSNQDQVIKLPVPTAKAENLKPQRKTFKT